MCISSVPQQVNAKVALAVDAIIQPLIDILYTGIDGPAKGLGLCQNAAAESTAAAAAAVGQGEKRLIASVAAGPHSACKQCPEGS